MTELDCMKKRLELMRLIITEVMNYAQYQDADLEAMMVGLESLIFLEADQKCDAMNMEIINAVQIAELFKQKAEQLQIEAELFAHKAAGGKVN